MLTSVNSFLWAFISDYGSLNSSLFPTVSRVFQEMLFHCSPNILCMNYSWIRWKGSLKGSLGCSLERMKCSLFVQSRQSE